MYASAADFGASGVRLRMWGVDQGLGLSAIGGRSLTISASTVCVCVLVLKMPGALKPL